MARVPDDPHLGTLVRTDRPLALWKAWGLLAVGAAAVSWFPLRGSSPARLLAVVFFAFTLFVLVLLFGVRDSRADNLSLLHKDDWEWVFSFSDHDLARQDLLVHIAAEEARIEPHPGIDPRERSG